MARLIDANAFCKELIEERDYPGRTQEFMDAIEVAIADLCDMPTVDAVKHGRWIDHMVRDWRCSECGKKVPRQVHFDGYCYNDKLNYCPNCGAKMDLPQITEQTENALEKMGEKAHGGGNG